MEIEVIKLDNENIEEVEVSSVIYDYTENISPEIFVKVKDIEIECFNVDSDEFVVGNIYDVTFSLITYKVNHITNETKSIFVKDKLGSTCFCTLSGKLTNIEIKYHEANDKQYYFQVGIVDCGIFVKIRIPMDFEANIGEYLYTDGRLDIKKA